LFKLGSDNVVRLNPSVKQSYINGEICPEEGDYQLVFLIESVIAGNSQRAATFQINSTLPAERRFSISDLESGGDASTWLPPGKTRPSLI